MVADTKYVFHFQTELFRDAVYDKFTIAGFAKLEKDKKFNLESKSYVFYLNVFAPESERARVNNIFQNSYQRFISGSK